MADKRILVSHCGSLARPLALLDIMERKESGQSYDKTQFDVAVRAAVTEVVDRQIDCGVDILCDGEQSKGQCFNYVAHRLAGFEVDENPPVRDNSPGVRYKEEVADFPEYYEAYFATAYYHSKISSPPPMVCVGPISYLPKDVLSDIAILKEATQDKTFEDLFMTATGPRITEPNRYYATQEEYEIAIADAMRREYKAIIDAGLLLQIDAPTMLRTDPGIELSAARKAIEKRIELLNYSLQGIPEDKTRFHICYAPNIGPKVHDPELKDVVDLMLTVKARYYSFEASNGRHYHDWQVWKTVKLPVGKVLMPGVSSHSSNVVEHPEFIAELLVKYANLVGRENVIASNDCGFSSTAVYAPEIHPSIAWAKFRAMVEGARLASERLWEAS